MKFNVRMTSDVLIYFCWLFFLKGYRKSLLSVIRQVGHCLRILFHPHPWLGLIFFREFKNYTLCLLGLDFFLFCFSSYIKLFFESVMHAYNEIRLYYLSSPPTYLSSSLGTLQLIFVPISCPLLVFFFLYESPCPFSAVIYIWVQGQPWSIGNQPVATSPKNVSSTTSYQCL